MTTYGFAKGYMYTGDGTLYIKVRIPSIHGPYSMKEYNGQPVRNYTRDENLPYYPSLLLPHLPNEGDVVAITSLDSGNNQFIVIGLTGGNYSSNMTNVGGV